MTDGVEVSLTC